jgi:ribonuclease HI
VRYLRPDSFYFLKGTLKTDTLVIYTDGAARGNPGPAAIGVVIRDEGGNTIASISRRLGVTTNNQAEYRAVIAGLEKAISLGTRRIMIKSDSELVVKQLNGQYKIKNTAFESVSITGIPREQNSAADALANKALDATG